MRKLPKRLNLLKRPAVHDALDGKVILNFELYFSAWPKELLSKCNLLEKKNTVADGMKLV